MSKHTPGPWGVSRHCKTLVEAANNRSICSAGGYADNRVDALDLDAENQANARLISQAPRMYELLSDALMAFDSPKHEGLHGEILETLEHIDGNC